MLFNPLSFIGIRKVHFLFSCPCTCVVCQMFRLPIVDTVFRLLMTQCPQNTSVNVIDLNSARIPSSWHSSVFSRGCFVLTVFTVLTCSSSLVASVQSYYFATPLHSCSSIHSVLQCSHSRQSQNLMPFKSFKVVTFEQVLGFDDGDSDGNIIILTVLKSS